MHLKRLQNEGQPSIQLSLKIYKAAFPPTLPPLELLHGP
jgi:hypothetical protein